MDSNPVSGVDRSDDPSPLLTDRVACSAQEVRELADYLKNKSHVQLPADLIDRGHAVEKAKIEGLENLGRLRTVFKDIGHVFCRALYGGERFSVAQALEVLSNPRYNLHPWAADAWRRIQARKYRFARKRSAVTVTLIEMPNDLFIADGNKRAIAAYLYALETGQSDFVLPVYCVVAREGKGSG